MKKLYLFAIVFALIISAIPFSVNAEDSVAVHTNAEISCEGFDYPQYITDEKEKTYADTEGFDVSTVNISREGGISHLYVIFDKIYGEWTLTDDTTQKKVTVGKDGFLHEYIDVEALFGKSPDSLTLTFERDAYIAEVYAFSDGTLPDWVQVWESPLEKADILLLSSHSDDEQLFFAGILPYYSGEVGADVQVVYLISHFDTHDRPHEQLNGLWTVGVRNYPIISDFPDLYSESLEGAVSAFEAKGCTYDDFTSFIVENIRRFKPQVLVTHDIKGEYGHGTHIYCTDVVTKSLPSISDPSFCPESADRWGTWDVPKTYLHLYDENKIVMNWDIPLKAFGGRTAFEMTVEGFACHKSQHWTWFNDWIHGTDSAPVTKAADIKTYSPCQYGLYRTTVGADSKGGDFLENITLYKEQLPPETEAPETEKTETVPPVTTQTPETQPKNEDSTPAVVDPMILILLLAGTVIIILVVFIIGNFSKKR